jgi:CBS domain-containing protein
MSPAEPQAPDAPGMAAAAGCLPRGIGDNSAREPVGSPAFYKEMPMEKTTVRDIMTSPAIVITPDTSVPIASALMKEHGIRHLPVVENGRLVGIVSRGDLREASISASANADTYEFNFLLNRLTVGRLMTRKVLTTTADAPVVHAAELMTERKIAGLPVVEPDGFVVGIVTESDLLKLLVRKLRETEDSQTGPDTSRQS